MKFMNVTTRELILIHREVKSKSETISDLVQLLALKGIIRDQNLIIQGFLKREEIGSTGVGFGVAFPNVKSADVDRPWLAIGISNHGIDWDSLDGEPVYLIFLSIQPPDNPNDRLRPMDMSFGKMFRNETFRRFLQRAENIDEVWQILEDFDNDLFID